MASIITWLVDAETLAEQLYAECAVYFKNNTALSEFLSTLSKDESGHKIIVTRLAEQNVLPSDIPIELSDDFKDRFYNSMMMIPEMMKQGILSEETLLRYIVDVEYSEWNEIFIYIARQYSRVETAHQFDVAMMQRHISRIARFITQENYTELLHKIEGIQKIWDYRIMIVDDEDGIRDLFAMLFGKNYRTTCASNGRDALDLLEQWHSDVIITDIDMPYMNGIELYEQLLQKDKTIADRMIFMTGNDRHIPYFQMHNLKYFMKPFKIDMLRALVDSLILE